MIKVGDVVTLKGSEYLMTVVKILEPGIIECGWFKEDEFKFLSLPEAALTVKNDEWLGQAKS